MNGVCSTCGLHKRSGDICEYHAVLNGARLTSPKTGRRACFPNGPGSDER